MSSKKGVGVPDTYKNDAHNKFDILWKVKIKDRKLLADDIPLHVSLRVFDSLNDKQLAEVKKKVKEFGIRTPDSKNLKFKTTIFHSKFNHKDYYMLKISGMDESCDKFFNYFKEGYGFSHPKFMSHVTIDKALYDDINKDGLKAEEVEFDDLTIENGASNTIHDFESLEKSFKGEINNGYSRDKMLASIALVKSKDDPNNKMIHGEVAIGKYSLMPMTIRETIDMHPDLKQKHKRALNLRGDDMRRYLQDNPDLEEIVAEKHIKRLEHHFGESPSKIGYAWLEGIRSTYRAEKENKDIENHWHVKKIKDAYAKEK